MSTNQDSTKLLELLARWQAFSELQQRAFAFLATEAVSAGEEFERSTDGATGVLTRIGEFASESAAAGDLQSETWAVVHKLQAADRSRQGLEQVASVLNTLKDLHEKLAEETRGTGSAAGLDAMLTDWIEPLSANVSLADWRRRLIDALHGRESAPAPEPGDDDELF